MSVPLTPSRSSSSRPTAWIRAACRVCAAILVLASGLAVAGCGSDDAPKEVTRHENVRGMFLGTASDGRDVVIHHEAVENVMPPMVMSLPVGNPEAADAIEVDQPVQFDLVIEGSEIRVENLTPLPDTTTLELGSPPQE